MATCLKMFEFKFKLFTLLDELGGMRVFFNQKVGRRKNKTKPKKKGGRAKMPEGFSPPLIMCKGRRDGPYMIKEQPLRSSCNPPGMDGASPKERNWLKPQLLCSSRIRCASGERLVGCNDAHGLYGNAHQPSAAAAAQTGGRGTERQRERY